MNRSTQNKENLMRHYGAILRVVLLLLPLFCVHSALADQISCVADGNGHDTCDITYPNVLAASTAYPDLIFQPGDVVTVTAGGCVQTGGSGKTWKRYVDPQGPNSGQLYHGEIWIPGAMPSLVRISTVMGTPLTSTGGSLTLGYEDDGYSDNGYWSHDDGTGNQCADQSGPNQGRAWIHLEIQHAKGPFAAAGTRYGMCHKLDVLHDVCHIDRPDVTHSTEAYPAIAFVTGDLVQVAARGCVQTGGIGATWKKYVNPEGPNADQLYYGMISIPGATAGSVRLQAIAGQTLQPSPGANVTLGYKDDAYSDNGYWSHDDGTQDQCKGVGPASLDITITHGGIPHLAIAGIEVTQEIQDMNQSVPLIAAKQTWARVYFSSTIGTPTEVTGTLNVQQGATTTTVGAQAPVTVVAGTSLRSSREAWTGSLNFQLPPGVITAGTTIVSIAALTNTTTSQQAPCECSTTQSVSFEDSPPLRLRVIGLTYPLGTSTAEPSVTDFDLLQSWLTRAYPVPGVDATTALVAANDATPFTCTQANSQVAAIRGNDISNGTDERTHYLGFVSNLGFGMRGCAFVPATPDASAVGSSPTGNPVGANVPVNVAGDTDGSFGDWYGGHELSHTFGRNHPGFCNGNSHDDPSFPYPNGQISDNNGDDTGLDVGAPPTLPLIVLPGAQRFDIMTYCNQPQWLSAYTYEGVLTNLRAENASGGAGGAGAPAGGARGFPPASSNRPFIHVVATLDLTAGTAKIRYVTPERVITPERASELRGEMRVLTAGGALIQTVPLVIRKDTDIPKGEHQTALGEAYVPYSEKIGQLQLLLGSQVKDEFRANQKVPVAPRLVKLERLTNGDRKVPGTFEVRWEPSGSEQDKLTYTVELSRDGKSWETLGIGLTQPAFVVHQSLSSATLVRVWATNGFLASEAVLVRGEGGSLPVIR